MQEKQKWYKSIKMCLLSKQHTCIHSALLTRGWSKKTTLSLEVSYVTPTFWWRRNTNCSVFYRASRVHSADYAVARCPSVTRRGVETPRRVTSGFQCLSSHASALIPGGGQSGSPRRQRSPTSITTCVTHRKSNIFGDRCFAVAGPRLWNSLPINLRQCHSLEQFKRLLRTFLFSAWSHGALWDLPKSVPYINLLTYLLLPL